MRHPNEKGASFPHPSYAKYKAFLRIKTCSTPPVKGGNPSVGKLWNG